MANTFVVPQGLIEAIRTGHCIAFVGAGFVQPSLPSWLNLLKTLAKSIKDKAARQDVEDWLKINPLTSRDYEGLAECIRSALGKSFEQKLAKALTVKLEPGTEERLKFLREIPFRAVLTTNFDGSIRGGLPRSECYEQILAAPPRSWWDNYYWNQDDGLGQPPPCVKLHGQVKGGRAEDLVFSTLDYRRRLYEQPGYLTFMRTLFATNTILYMGFSFTDAYVNEIRSEVLALYGRTQRRLDYAIVNDVSDVAAQHFCDSDRLKYLSYSTNDFRDFSGFEKWLVAIRSVASPERVLAALVKGKRILWVDAVPSNNDHGLKVLGDHAMLECWHSPTEALKKLRRFNKGSAPGSERYDLVITRFGWRSDGSDCQDLLVGMRRADLRCPVIVFAGGACRQVNRNTALSLGALAYTDTWEELFGTLEGLFSDPRQLRLGDTSDPA